MNKKLSILTCTITKRKHLLENLDKTLLPQLKNMQDVEILTNIDSGEKSIGQKRNELLQAAKGNYVVFVDDDDLVSNNYVKSILTAISYNSPDCCGIEGEIFLNKNFKKKFMHSLRYKEWYEDENGFYRPPNHINPIKREIALDIGFENISHGEDKIFSEKILPFLKTEVYIKCPIYLYIPSNEIKK